MIKILKDNSDNLDELRYALIEVINKHNQNVTGYELLGVLESVKQDCLDAILSNEGLEE